jgi:DUF1680 family protein
MRDLAAPAVSRPLPAQQVRLSGGVLADRCRKNIANLFMGIQVEGLARVYAETHGSWYAEPEFCGHYLDTAAQVHGTTGSDEVLERARHLVESILANQRADGYLGTYERGLEFDGTFSVWNETLTVKGLLSYYEETRDARALSAAMRCVDRLAGAYMAPDGPDLFRSVNQGVENLCIISQLPRLYALSGKQLYLDFAVHLLDRAEATGLKLVTGPGLPAPISSIGCLKGAEMLICYAGLVDLHRVTGDGTYLSAATGYWDAVCDSQIGPTGNGSIAECWTYLDLSRLALSVPAELRPNENCVAVTWMKLSAALFGQTGRGAYIDAMERTLYNHLLGAQALDGTDFSYYQATRGRKVHATDPGQYSCCRYRGMNMLAHLPRYVYAESDDALAVNLYCGSEAEASIAGHPVTIVQETDYPRTGRVAFQVRAEEGGEFVLALRMPAWCRSASIAVNGQPEPATSRDGYLRIERAWSAEGDRVELEFDMPVGSIAGRCDDRDVVAVTYGPLVLALDSCYGVPIEGTELVVSQGMCRRVPESAPDGLTPLVRFRSPGRHLGAPVTLTLVDYASAGSVDPERDRFLTWLPIASDGRS